MRNVTSSVARHFHFTHMASPLRRFVASSSSSSAAALRTASTYASTPAFHVLNASPRSSSAVLLTCEHAAAELPPPLRWSAADSRLAHGSPRRTHWSHDPGSADFTREFAQLTDSAALLGAASRLFVDLNRPLVGSPTLFRDTADGKPIELNAALDDGMRSWRILHAIANIFVEGTTC
jgi:predicted N-formylglutamate amidohydrolase